MGAAEGWVVTHDGETLKTGFKNDFEAINWLHRRHSYSVDHAVKHEGYDIVLIKNGQVAYSYKRDSGRQMGTTKTKKSPMPIWPEFVDAYLEAALWSSATGDEESPLDSKYGISDFSKEAVDQAVKDANKFIRENRSDLEAAIQSASSRKAWDPTARAVELNAKAKAQHGHDFWLTRNGHGAGFWDRGYGPAGDRLTKAAHAYGETNAYAGDDGKIYFL